jgi:polar amino acid transport system permease protein
MVGMLPPYGNLLIEVMKASALVSLIALRDLLQQAQNLRQLRVADTVVIFGVTLLMYFAIALVITGVVRLLERRSAGVSTTGRRRHAWERRSDRAGRRQLGLGVRLGDPPRMLRGLWVTVQLTGLGISSRWSAGSSWPCSGGRSTRWSAGRSALFIEFIRSTPLLVQLFFLFFVLPDYGMVLSGFTAGVVGLAIHYATYTSETYRAGIESVDRGQWEAATAINLSNARPGGTSCCPRPSPRRCRRSGNYVVASLKDAPLAATITVFGVLGTAQQIQAQTFRSLEPLTLAGLLFLAVSVPAAALVRLLEKRHAFDRT